MSVFDEILCKINEISNRYVGSLNDDLKVALDCIDKFAEEYQNGRSKHDTTAKNKNLMNTLQSINEDEDETTQKVVRKSKDGSGEKKRHSNKRGKHEVDGMSSPEQEKRQKRNASVKAQTNISKQVNVNLTQKLRREDTMEKSTRRRKDGDHEDKENAEPMVVKVKQEKISLPPEPMEVEATLDIQIKQETNKDDFAMPPPAAPVSRSRKAVQKEKSTDSEEEHSGTRRTRTRKQTDTMPPPAVPATEGGRAVRASRRATKQTEAAAPAEPEQPEPRPKRTRAKKKAPESSTDNENFTPPQENGIGSPSEKPRPKRTRRGKAAEKEDPPKPKEPTPEPEMIKPKEERISQPETQTSSPPIPQKSFKGNKTNDTTMKIIPDDSLLPKVNSKAKAPKSKMQEAISLEETQVICPMNVTMTVEKTFVLPNGESDHADGKTIAMNETVVLEKMNRDTMVLEKPQTARMDATVVIDKDGVQKDGTPNITDDMSILTDDNSDAQEFATPPQKDTPPQPTSAVKAKVQQFEEMAARTTRTKTRAMAKKDAETETSTPPDKIISKQILSVDTLTKMNNMIFNGKTTQISASATKPTAKLPPTKTLPASASKATAITKAREEIESRGKDDARKKKEAMLEAKKEQQRRKREEKMAAAAAAREAAERERRAAVQAAARERMEKQAHVDQGKLERMREVEKKKQELARKVAETEERRRAEEQARQARLAEEQKKAEAARKKQLEDSEAVKREAAMMAKEIEKRQKEYVEKQKMKQRLEDKLHTPLKNFGTPSGKPLPAMEPVYMADGFQFLNSDDEDEAPKFPVPAWSTSKARLRQLAIQHLLPTSVIDRFFSVRVHSPDLRAIFPSLERRDLKRTSSAVWRTPPALQLSRVQESPV